MKQKHLALALSAIFAATALAGCGSDGGDYSYDPEKPPVVTPPTDGGETPPTDGGETPPTDGGETPPTDGGETPEPPIGDGEVTDPAEPGDFDLNSSVVGQQYIRGTTAKFDKNAATNNDLANNGSSTVTNFKDLQNKKMTNIVVAQYPDATRPNADGTPGIVQYVLGAKPVANPQISDDNSLQNENDVDVLGAFVNVTKEQSADTAPLFNITGVETNVITGNENITQGHNSAGAEAAGKNNVRVFGALSTTATDAEIAAPGFANSAAYLVKDNNGNAVNLNSFDVETNGFDTKGLKLNKVQYGRVTGKLEGVKATDIAGKTYIVADFADKNIAGNTDQTDIYFYRGLDQTSTTRMNELQAAGGTYQYAGHALMYGIDNSFNGEDGAGGSNSVAFGTNGNAVGNFVQAEYDATNRKVTGSIYNVWNKDKADNTGKEVKAVDLVKFNGDVKGNTVLGESYLTYKTGDKGSFTGSFFGKNAEEMGGALNSISQEYGKSAWGGVFGAQQLPKDKVDVPSTEQPTIPPIFNTGKDSK